MAQVPDDITKVDPSKRCYEGASAKGQLKFRNGGAGWKVHSSKNDTYVSVGAAATLAMGFTECLAELGRGKVSIFPKHDLNRKVPGHKMKP